MFGPAGAAIWSSPTIDRARKLVYATTRQQLISDIRPAEFAAVLLALHMCQPLALSEWCTLSVDRWRP